MKVIAVVLLVFALIIGIAPQFLDCQSQGRAIELSNGKTVPMKCHWTAIAELAVAVPLAAVAILMFVSKRKETFLALGILGAILGLFVLLFPSGLIGTCSSDMLCNIAMKPLLILSGAVVVIASLAAAIMALRTQEMTV